MSDDRELQGNLPAEDLPGDNSPVEELREEVEKAQRQPDKYGIFAAKSGNSWIEDCINMAAPIIAIIIGRHKYVQNNRQGLRIIYLTRIFNSDSIFFIW